MAKDRALTLEALRVMDAIAIDAVASLQQQTNLGACHLP